MKKTEGGKSGQDYRQDKEETASKLFSHLLRHGENCGLELVVERLGQLTGRSVTEKEALDFITSFSEKFLVKTVDEKKCIEAKTDVKLCDSFQNEKCESGSRCPQLHICRFFLEGSCKFGDECKKGHSFDAPQTRNLLTHHKLENISSEELQSLFRKVLNEKKIRHASQASATPERCSFYNKGSCKNGDKCQFLHVCEHYVNGDCMFGKQKCKRDHHFDTAHSKKILAAHSLGHYHDKSQIRSILRGGEEKPNGDSDDDSDKDDSFSSSSKKPKPRSSTSTADDKLEICGFNLRGKCNYGDKCKAYHSNLPYQWQYLLPPQKSWSSFADTQNQYIEKVFCAYEMSNSISSTTSDGGLISYSLDVQAMTWKINEHGSGKGPRSTTIPIRRLSTISSVLTVPGNVFRTKWNWYWKDEHDKWQSYDDGDVDTNSEKIELDYLKESGEKKHAFSSASNKYILHMDDPNNLYQQNENYGTKRDVRRRPAKFVEKEAMKDILEEYKINCQRTSSSSETPSLPSHWTSLDPSEEFKVVTLDSKVLHHHDEFAKVEEQFLATMKGCVITSIKRVQNRELWEEYERQKSKITKKNSGKMPEERWLFHGTNKQTVEPICQQGFDWRLSGKHGTRYGKGSYFATEASYSNNYTARSSSSSSHGNLQMFLSRVIVGSFVVGGYETQRPPSKDSSDPLSLLHDSCVNDVSNPSIFVVFERSQAYPYYIIEY